MNAHRIETTISQDGTLTITNLPFHAGAAVEVIVLESSLKPSSANHYPLRGKPLHYDAPTEPVEEKDAAESQRDLSPPEKVRLLREWAATHSLSTPLLSDEAVSRESIYGERG